MPHISRYRYVNFVYGKKKNRLMTDKAFEPMGDNIQVEATNTVGKSISILTLLQPIVPFIDTNKKSTDVFTDKKEPFYVLIEWILEDGSKLLTGIGIQRKQTHHSDTNKRLEKSRLFDYIIFTVEYDRENPLDINNIPLTEVKNNRLYCKGIKEAEGIIKGTNEVKARIFPKSKIREYKEYLKSFAIYTDEWQSVIAPLNKGESQLTEYFEKNNTIEKLMKNVILPAVEENINRSYSKAKIDNYDNKNDVDQIKDIQKMLINYKESIDKHKRNLEDYDRLKKLEEKIDDINISVQSAVGIEAKMIENKVELSKLYNTSEKIINDMHYERIQNKKNLDDLDEKVKELKYNEKSLEYHALLNKKESKVNEANKLLSGIHENDKKVERIERELKLCKVKRFTEDLAYWEREKGKQIIQKEKLELTEKEILGKLKNLGYSLNVKYKEQLVQLNKQKEALESTQNELNEIKDELNEKRESLRNELTNIKVEKSNVESWIKEYDKREKKIIEKYADVSKYIDMTIEGKTFRLEKLSQELNNEIDEIQNTIELKMEKLESNKNKVKKNNIEIISLTKEIGTYEGEIKKQTNELDNFEKEKSYILSLFGKYDLEEKLLFLRDDVRNTINELIKSKTDKLERIKNKKDSLEKELNFLKGGNDIIPKRIKDEFIELGIKVITGLEFINKQGYSYGEKNRIYNNNPFLPYSMVITKKEYEILKNTEFKGENTLPIPLVLFNDIEDENTAFTVIKNLCEIEEQKFITFFDRDIFDHERVKMRIYEAENEIQRLNEIRGSIEAVIKELGRLAVKIEDFNYNEQHEEKMNERLRKAETEKVIRQQRVADLENENIGVNEQISILEKEVSLNNLSREKKKHKLNDISVFVEEYSSKHNKYYKINIELGYKNDEIRSELEKNKKGLIEVEEKQNKTQNSIIEVKTKLKTFDNEAQKYSGYSDGTIIDNSISYLEGEFKNLSKESNASNLEEINASIAEATRKVLDISNNIKKIERLIGLGYESELIREFDEDKLEITLKDANIEKSKLSEEKGKSLKEVQQLSENIEKLSIQIEKNFEKEPIKNKNEILIQDYKLRISEIDEEKKKVSDLNLKLDNREKVINNLLVRLEEFKGITEDKYLEVVEEELKEKVSEKLNIYKERQIELEDIVEIIRKEETLIAQYFIEEDRRIYEILARERNFTKKMEVCMKIKNQIDAKLDILEATVKSIDSEREYINKFIKDYVDTVIRGISKLNDIAKINGQKLMKVSITKDSIDYSVINRMIQNIVEGSIQVNNYINTFNLLDQIVRIKTIKVEIIQYELYSSNFINWEELKTNTTGAQQFCISFILLTVLMEYKRVDEKEIRKESFGKVLVMDNPFGEISEASLLKPMFELAKKLKVQIISYTHIQNQAIRDSFGKIYLLKVNKSSQTNREYVEHSVLKDTINESAERSSFFAEQITIE